jgi:CRP-like cAMP-binding protein
MMFFDLFRREPNILELPAGQHLFREGEASNGLMYVLVAGRADVRVGELLVEQAITGTILGEMAMIGHEPRSASVQAITDCRFAAINRKRFLYLVAEAPQFATEVMRVLADRLRRADNLLVRRTEGQ